MPLADLDGRTHDVFLYTLHPVPAATSREGPTPAEQRVADRHRAYRVELLERGIVVFAGRALGRDADGFAALVVRAADERVARTIAQADPGVRAGLLTVRLYPFQPLLMGDRAATLPTNRPDVPAHP